MFGRRSPRPHFFVFQADPGQKLPIRQPGDIVDSEFRQQERLRLAGIEIEDSVVNPATDSTLCIGFAAGNNRAALFAAVQDQSVRMQKIPRRRNERNRKPEGRPVLILTMLQNQSLIRLILNDSGNRADRLDQIRNRNAEDPPQIDMGITDLRNGIGNNELRSGGTLFNRLG